MTICLSLFTRKSERRNAPEPALIVSLDINQKQNLSDKLNQNFQKWRNINRKIDRVLLFILLLAIFIVGSALLDNLKFLDHGINGVKYQDFDKLLQINPDTVAWLIVDDTYIDHPVVQGKDNFEYLDKDFYGKYYAGGTLFLDCDNKKDFSDEYSIIHGHNMTKHAMFGDLVCFMDASYFNTHRTGTLLTIKHDFDLKILAAGKFDAYDGSVYCPGGKIPEDVMKKCPNNRMKERNRKNPVLALSTCAGSMDTERIIVFCEMTNKRKHE